MNTRRMAMMAAVVVVVGWLPLAAQEHQAKTVPVKSIMPTGQELSHIKVVYKDGGPDGFLNIELNSDDDIVPMETTLIAIGVGSDKADINQEWRMAALKKDPPRLIDYAREQIANGTLNGEHSITENSVRYDVSWHAQDSYNLTIEETHYTAE